MGRSRRSAGAPIGDDELAGRPAWQVLAAVDQHRRRRPRVWIEHEPGPAELAPEGLAQRCQRCGIRLEVEGFRLVPIAPLRVREGGGEVRIGGLVLWPDTVRPCDAGERG